MSKRQPQAQPVCPLCQAALQFGVQHICPIAQQQVHNGDDLRGFFWKLFGSIIIALVLQLGGAIWWASRVQATIDNFKDQLAQQQVHFKEQLDGQAAIIDRLDSYFRRPPPQ